MRKRHIRSLPLRFGLCRAWLKNLLAELVVLRGQGVVGPQNGEADSLVTDASDLRLQVEESTHASELILT